MPYFEQSPPTAPHCSRGSSTFWCVKVSWMSCMFTPRSVAKLKLVRLMPTSSLSLPSVAARSAKIGAGGRGGALRHAALEAEGLAAARRADRDAADALAERVADERDERSVLGARRRDEVLAVHLERGRVVRVARAGEEERLLARAEDEELGDPLAQVLRVRGGRDAREEKRREGDGEAAASGVEARGA